MKTCVPLCRWLLPGLAALGGLIAVAAWLSAGTRLPLQERVPGLDQAETTEGARGSSIPESGLLTQGDGRPADLPGQEPST